MLDGIHGGGKMPSISSPYLRISPDRPRPVNSNQAPPSARSTHPWARGNTPAPRRMRSTSRASTSALHFGERRIGRDEVVPRLQWQERLGPLRPAPDKARRFFPRLRAVEEKGQVDGQGEVRPIAGRRDEIRAAGGPRGESGRNARRSLRQNAARTRRTRRGSFVVRSRADGDAATGLARAQIAPFVVDAALRGGGGAGEPTQRTDA